MVACIRADVLHVLLALFSRRLCHAGQYVSNPNINNAAVHQDWRWDIEVDALAATVSLTSAALQVSNFVRYVRSADPVEHANCIIYQRNFLLFLCATSSLAIGDELILPKLRF
jgi:hypothetical protein